MNKSVLPTFQSLLQNYFLQRLIQQRKVSGQTVNSYRDHFEFILHFLMRHMILTQYQ